MNSRLTRFRNDLAPCADAAFASAAFVTVTGRHVIGVRRWMSGVECDDTGA